ncbi:hypothetical protein [Rhizobium sp. AC27/96]|uniref:hypothetical protein n=2 Tax=Rhizobium TaxID=379 RepID=UPI001146D082|nr:hypothetical protein [Rhizobium sp. AC27/96]
MSLAIRQLGPMVALRTASEVFSAEPNRIRRVSLEIKRRNTLAEDQSRNPHGGRENEQSLAKIQHSKAHDVKQAADTDDKGALVADPRNRLVDGKIDPVTKELKPKGK